MIGVDFTLVLLLCVSTISAGERGDKKTKRCGGRSRARELAGCHG
jgi:hypothetical protein